MNHSQSGLLITFYAVVLSNFDCSLLLRFPFSLYRYRRRLPFPKFDGIDDNNSAFLRQNDIKRVNDLIVL